MEICDGLCWTSTVNFLVLVQAIFTSGGQSRLLDKIVARFMLFAGDCVFPSGRRENLSGGIKIYCWLEGQSILSRINIMLCKEG